MRRVNVTELDPSPEGDSDLDRRSLTDALETEELAVNYYRLDPGETLAGGLHAHLDQEELFYVLEGTVTFEMKEDPDGTSQLVRVSEGEAIKFARGDYQQGRNESDGEVVTLALGAPQDSTDGRVPRECPGCGDSPYMDTVLIDGQLAVQCPECDAVQDSGLH